MVQISRLLGSLRLLLKHLEQASFTFVQEIYLLVFSGLSFTPLKMENRGTAVKTLGTIINTRNTVGYSVQDSDIPVSLIFHGSTTVYWHSRYLGTEGQDRSLRNYDALRRVPRVYKWVCLLICFYISLFSPFAKPSSYLIPLHLLIRTHSSAPALIWFIYLSFYFLQYSTSTPDCPVTTKRTKILQDHHEVFTINLHSLR